MCSYIFLIIPDYSAVDQQIREKFVVEEREHTKKVEEVSYVPAAVEEKESVLFQSTDNYQENGI